MKVAAATRIESGIPGLDQVLHGGFLPGRAYLVTGAPGSGKTLFGFHFLAAGSSKQLFVSFTQKEQHLREDAEAVGIATAGVTFVDLTPEADMFVQAQSYDIFTPAEVEREPIARAVRESIEQHSPDRIFIDGFTQLRMMSTDPFHFLRMAQSFFRFASGHGATVLVSSNGETGDVVEILESAVDGIIHLAGRGNSRVLEVIKMRSGDFSSGPHSLRITSNGLEIFAKSG